MHFAPQTAPKFGSDDFPKRGQFSQVPAVNLPGWCQYVPILENEISDVTSWKNLVFFFFFIFFMS